MSRIGVTYEEVELQAETLVAKGENPTLEKVRRALGDRGSNSTLSKYINEWRRRRAKSTPMDIRPINLSDPVNEAVNRVWHQLREEAQAEIAKIKEESLETIQALNKEKDTAILERNQAFFELETLKGNLSELKTTKLSLESILNQTQKELDIAKIRIEENERRYEEFKREKEKQMQEITEAKDKNIQYLKEQIQSQNQSHQQEINEFRTWAEDQRHQWIVKEDNLKVEIARKENALKKMEGIEQQSQQLMIEFRQQLKQRDSDIRDLLEEQKKLMDKLMASEKTLSFSESALIESRRWADERKQEKDSLEQLLRQERERVGRLEERNTQLEKEFQSILRESQMA